jgi:hypothetical protein
MPLSFAVLDVLPACFSSLESEMVLDEGEREKVFARGPKCVSFSSASMS